MVDGFFPTDAGAFTASISGPGTTNDVPEHASTLALLSVSGLLLAGIHKLISTGARLNIPQLRR